MPRHRRGRISDSSSSEQNARRQDDDDDDFDVCFDLRDIPGQIEKEAKYIQRNQNRSPNVDTETMYTDTENGTRIGRWAGRRNAGESLNAGLLSTGLEAGIYENELNVGNFNAGVTDECDQKGVEAEASALSLSHRLGPAKVNAQALAVGYEAGIGRNTGGFVRSLIFFWKYFLQENLIFNRFAVILLRLVVAVDRSEPILE